VNHVPQTTSRADCFSSLQKESRKLFRLHAPCGPAGAIAPALPACRAPSRAGGGNAGRVSCSRPEWRSRAFRDDRSLWQGLSPLPQHHAVPWPAGGHSPRPAPDPPPAGASRPPGQALAFRGAWTDRSTGHRAARAGETPCVSWSRPERSFPGCPVSLAGAIAPATSLRGTQGSRGGTAPGGCLAPAGPGAGLSLRLQDGSLRARNGQPPFRRISTIFPSGRRATCVFTTPPGGKPACLAGRNHIRSALPVPAAMDAIREGPIRPGAPGCGLFHIRTAVRGGMRGVCNPRCNGHATNSARA